MAADDASVPEPAADRMVADGRAIRLETVGRITGRPAAAVLGFAEEPGGSLLVAAGDVGADWAANLDAQPRCRVTIRGETLPFIAEPLGRADHALAVRELILRYGTPSERLGAGPSFRLRPGADAAGVEAMPADASRGARSSRRAARA